MTEPAPSEDDSASARAVLDFWLGEVGRAGWFRIDPDVDAACAARFSPLVDRAIRGGLDGWLGSREGALALVILLDQLPRNIHRGAAAAFAGDAKARWVADRAIALGHDRATPTPQRVFFYLPFEHSEDIGDQDRAIALIAERVTDDKDWLRHAAAHRELIQRFGRFPHRNTALGRASTSEEAAFLADGGYAPGATAKTSGDGA